MTPSPSDAVLHPSVRALLDLFSQQKHARFPDLEPAHLEALAERVRERADALIRAEAEVKQEERLLAESQEALLAKAHRAVSYLRIYAEERPELKAQLESLSLPRLTKKDAPIEGVPAPRPRRGRPPKSGGASASLFSAEAQAKDAIASEAPSVVYGE